MFNFIATREDFMIRQAGAREVFEVFKALIVRSEMDSFFGDRIGRLRCLLLLQPILVLFNLTS